MAKREYMEPDGTFSPASALNHELTQFQRLRQAFPDLPDAEYAHRLVTTKRQVQKMRKLIGE